MNRRELIKRGFGLAVAVCIPFELKSKISAQERFLNTPFEELAFGGARGGGKTFILARFKIDEETKRKIKEGGWYEPTNTDYRC